MAQMGSKAGNQDYDRMVAPLDNEELEGLYLWVDQISLSRTKRNISRDFSDGVLILEIVKHFYKRQYIGVLVPSASGFQQKRDNWLQLNRHVFTRLNFELADEVINDLAAAKPGMIEKVLLMLKMKITHLQYAQRKQNDKPEADQHMTPGRKNGRMVKGVMDDGKGSKFVKTKHTITQSRLALNAPVRRSQLQDHRPPPKMPAKPAVIPKRRPTNMVESDMVPRYLLEEKEQEVLSRDETVQILQAKVKKMEHLLYLKDMRIGDLTEHAGNKANDYKIYYKPSAYSDRR